MIQQKTGSICYIRKLKWKILNIFKSNRGKKQKFNENGIFQEIGF